MPGERDVVERELLGGQDTGRPRLEGQEVVVLWRQRAVARTDAQFDNPVLGLYRVRDGKLARLQMFHFDTAAVVAFLAQARAG